MQAIQTLLWWGFCKGPLKNWRLKIIQALLIRIKRANMSHLSRYHLFSTMKKSAAEKEPRGKKSGTNEIFQEAKYSWLRNLVTQIFWFVYDSETKQCCSREEVMRDGLWFCTQRSKYLLKGEFPELRFVWLIYRILF